MNNYKTECEIVKIIYSNNGGITNSDKMNSDKLRTKKWLEKIIEIIDIRGN